MSQYDDDDDFDNEGNSINDVRKALRAEQKLRKAAEAELTTYRAESRKRELSDTIVKRGLDPKIAGLIPVDADVETWLETFGPLFAALAPAATATDEQAVTPAPEGASTFSEVANTGAAPTGDEGQLMALISGAKTPEELSRILGIL